MPQATRKGHVPVGVIPTPLYARLDALSTAKRWTNWAGFVSPLVLDTAEFEYFAIRNQSTLFDISPMHKYRVTGPDALSVVNRLVTRDAGRMRDGRVGYALWCDEEGMVIDEDKKGKISFARGAVSDAASIAGLPGGEKSLYARLLGSREVISLDKRFGKTLQSAQSSLQSAIRHEYGGKFFKHNLGWFVPGIFVGAITLILGLILQQPSDAAMSIVMPALFTSIFGTAIALFGWFMFSNPVAYRITRLIGGILLLAGSLAIGAAALGVLLLGDLPAWQVAGLLTVIGIVMIALMFFLLGAPTLKGAKVLPRIEGFKLYLETAETNRLNMRDAPQMSEELYERYLPYAAGLGVEEPWSKAWAAHLARVSPDRKHDYHPTWYRGRSWTPDRIGSATAASVAAVSAAMASAMPQPKSSSGSSGGGFSGGGGGGGGGGGW